MQIRWAATVVLLCVVGAASAADWPTYRSDAARSGYTPEPLPKNLSLAWTCQAVQPLEPAWPSLDRMPFDRAYQPVIGGGAVYFGSSADGKVHALDAASGVPRWTCATDAPVRFAPAVWRDRVLVASDDGFLYCLDAADGRVHWKHRGGPRPDMLLGNDRMVSRWPARGGPVVVDGTVYYGAGIWPTEGFFLYAIDVATGRVLWSNDSAGSIEMDQPHPGARAKSGVAAQGHLVAAGDVLLVPTGRAVPAAFDRARGTFRYFHLQANRGLGGSEVTAVDRRFFNSGTLFDLASGAAEVALSKSLLKKTDRAVPDAAVGDQIAMHPRWIVVSSGKKLAAIDRGHPVVERQTTSAAGKKTRAKHVAEPAWKIDLPHGPLGALIVAGDWIVAGGKDQVLAVEATSGREAWSTEVRGRVFGLAAAGGRLYASTDQGMLYCFVANGSAPIVPGPRPALPAPSVAPTYAATAKEIVETSGITEGYCLDLGSGDGSLALELAHRTKLRIYAVESDPARVQAARRMLDAAGMHGSRVTVHQADPATVAYPNYFADLVVSGRSVMEGVGVVPRQAAARMQRPCGGVACFGRAGTLERSVRGRLDGAGDWTHLYADAANTLCSSDSRIHGPLAMLWYRDTDLVMPSRHGRSPSPLVADGRMYVEGLTALRAVNQYNGRTLWQIPLPKTLQAYHQDHLTGVAATGSNLCLGGDRLFVHAGATCLVLDARTGQTMAEWPAPPRDGKPGVWGWLACRDGMLLGTLANPQHLVKESWRSFLGKLDMTQLFSESTFLFALDAQSGRLKWSFTPDHSIRHNAIALGPGRVYLIDRPLALADTPRPVPKGTRIEHPPGRLVCLDSSTGSVLWQTNQDVFGTLLALSEKHGVLLMSFQPTRFQLDSEAGTRMAGYRAADGKRLWSIEAKYQSRPIVNDAAIFAEPGKWDLLTGQRLPFQFSRSYGCGILAGSSRMLVFRSATLGYVDLEHGEGTQNFGGIRPGCWVNAIPAGGLVLMADAASWCTCSYLNQATVALEPREP